AARIVSFGDAGWAGTRDDFDVDPLLVSAGAGVTLLAGLLRARLAPPVRGGSGWSLRLHLDPPLRERARRLAEPGPKATGRATAIILPARSTRRAGNGAIRAAWHCRTARILSGEQG